MPIAYFDPAVVALELELQKHPDVVGLAGIEDSDDVITCLNKIAAVLNLALDGKFRIGYVAEELRRQLENKRLGVTTIYSPFPQQLSQEEKEAMAITAPPEIPDPED